MKLHQFFAGLLRPSAPWTTQNMSHNHTIFRFVCGDPSFWTGMPAKLPWEHCSLVFRMAMNGLLVMLLKYYGKHKANFQGELLATVTLIRHFRRYLLSQHFTVLTDHRALQWLHNFKDPDGITACWLEKTTPFDYEARHRPGKSIRHAVGFSRNPHETPSAISTEQQSSDLSVPDEDNWERSKIQPFKEGDHALMAFSNVWPNQEGPATSICSTLVQTPFRNHTELVGIVYDASDSIGIV